MGKTIGIIVAIFLFAIVYIMLVIIRSSKQTYNTYKEHRKYIEEQKDDLICQRIDKLDLPVSFYRKKYTHIVRFKNINTHQLIDLYVEEYDALDLIIDYEYHIIHDSVVAFDIKKTIV